MHLTPLLSTGIRYAVAGGELAPPPAVERLLRRLPPAHCFAGPFVIVDGLLSHLGNIILPDHCALRSLLTGYRVQLYKFSTRTGVLR